MTKQISANSPPLNRFADEIEHREGQQCGHGEVALRGARGYNSVISRARPAVFDSVGEKIPLRTVASDMTALEIFHRWQRHR